MALFVLPLVTAAMTGFYMFRLMALTFWGEFRGPKAVWDKVHESAPVMTIPLILLYEISILAAVWMAPKRDDDAK